LGFELNGDVSTVGDSAIMYRAYNAPVRERDMDYVKGILCGLAAILTAEFLFFWPIIKGSKATGLAAVVGLSLESLLSPRFWIVALLLFGIFFAASRGGTVLRVLFFWIPTLTVSALGLSIFAMYAYLFFALSRHR
jgi:hypothetical protein